MADMTSVGLGAKEPEQGHSCTIGAAQCKMKMLRFLLRNY